ncbi:hypothetical protein [Altererythrobacter sp. Root672]|uniref:hypothetical protein n=1 Tax=Altererythrobacter sp. Root672 TaxID=1736584 RepID=UPI0006F347E0|nr:hypothetical protein [Altererythrobacter sp. Root672]KRA80312.1 hypothetical protein ASD76_14110 [Altererythrobacter sp. Root672]
MSGALAARLSAALERPLAPAVAEFARQIGEEAGSRAVLFYGSNLRTGSLEGVLDFYVLLPGEVEGGIWPRVSYREKLHEGITLRAKIATMNLATFAAAAGGEKLDTTIWARFVQPAGLAWSSGPEVASEVTVALAAAAQTAARLAVVLGPAKGVEEDYWRALFRATYRAELRVEAAGREESIIAANRSHFEGLLPLALAAQGVPLIQVGQAIEPKLDAEWRREVQQWWVKRRRFGKLLNLARLAKASTTFEGGMRYIAWKVERHTGEKVEVTPLREKYPVLAGPAILRRLLRFRRREKNSEL